MGASIANAANRDDIHCNNGVASLYFNIRHNFPIEIKSKLLKASDISEESFFVYINLIPWLKMPGDLSYTIEQDNGYDEKN